MSIRTGWAGMTMRSSEPCLCTRSWLCGTGWDPDCFLPHVSEPLTTYPLPAFRPPYRGVLSHEAICCCWGASLHP